MELTARRETHGVLSDIDDLLDGHNDLRAKIAFDNLLPEDDFGREAGELWIKRGEGAIRQWRNRQLIDEHYQQNGWQREMNGCNPPPSQPTDTPEEEVHPYCDHCWVRGVWEDPYGDKPDRWVYHVNGQVRYRDNISELMRPYLIEEDELFEIQEGCADSFWSGFIQYQHNNWDALMYSIEFFGGEEYVLIETDYGKEAIRLSEVM